MKVFIPLILALSLSCTDNEGERVAVETTTLEGPSIIVLGTCQDAGSPHINCQKDCCVPLRSGEINERRMVVSLGVVDPIASRKFLFEATPDMTHQLAMMRIHTGVGENDVPDGVFLTHAHIGHYTGLMYFGKEAMDAQRVPVFGMPRMRDFLASNGPWSQLVSRENITLRTLASDSAIELTQNVSVTPFLVPHRDEYSETVGYRIDGPNKSAVFIPDIDKWSKWNKSIVELVQTVDYAFVDATFFDGAELNNRDISQIPHPFVIESMELMDALRAEEKRRVIFIHFNHTNKLLDTTSAEYQSVVSAGFRVAKTSDVYPL